MKNVIVVLAALALMAGSAYAAEWNFYGQAKIQTFWTDKDTIGYDEPDSAEYDTQYHESLHGLSRIGAKVKVSDELTGRFEYGAGGGNANIRLLYGEWDFGSGKLKVGQDWMPLNWINSSQAFDENTLNPNGTVYSHRAAQIGLTFGDFKLAFSMPSTDVDVSEDGEDVETQVVIPSIEATYQLDLDMVTLDFGAGYSTFEATVDGHDEDVDSYVLAMDAKFDMAGFFMKGSVYYGQNVGNLLWMSVDGDYTTHNDGYATIDIDDEELLDNECLGLTLIAGYKINDTFTVEAGYGYTQTELDHYDDDDAATYYINTTITLAPGVFVVPEVGFFDGKDDGDTEMVYYGMKWQINF